MPRVERLHQRAGRVAGAHRRFEQQAVVRSGAIDHDFEMPLDARAESVWTEDVQRHLVVYLGDLHHLAATLEEHMLGRDDRKQHPGRVAEPLAVRFVGQDQRSQSSLQGPALVVVTNDEQGGVADERFECLAWIALVPQPLVQVLLVRRREPHRTTSIGQRASDTLQPTTPRLVRIGEEHDLAPGEDLLQRGYHHLGDG